MKKTAAGLITELLEGRDLTFSDLMALTGLKHATVTTGLYQLRQMGILKTEILGRKSKTGRPRVIYSVESAAV